MFSTVAVLPLPLPLAAPFWPGSVVRAYALAISCAWAAACALDTRPASTRSPATVDTRMLGSSGISWDSEVCRPPASALTTTLMTSHAPLLPCTIMLVVPTAIPTT
jgi:hypothetical protein